jgi:hypothetical protein
MLRRGCLLLLSVLLLTRRQLVLALRRRCGLLRPLELLRPTMGIKTPGRRRMQMQK